MLGCVGYALFGSAAAWATCYVDGAATGANDGSTWRDAYSNPQFALLNSTCKEIWVAKGVYKPTLGLLRNISFVIPADVQMYGGFSGDETNRDQRLPGTYITVLSGDIDNNDANVATTGIDDSSADIHGNNSFHVVYFNGSLRSAPVGPSTVLDGFTITGGSATGPEIDGGGIYCRGTGNGRDDSGVDCSPLLKNLIIIGNTASNDAGGLYDSATSLGQSSPLLINVVFHGNTAGHAGGGMSTVADDGGDSSPTLNTVFFDSNAAVVGGGIAVEMDGQIADGRARGARLSSVVFAANHASAGGGMCVRATNGGETNPILNTVTFNDNSTDAASASPYGGGFFAVAEGAGSAISPAFTNATFNGNKASLGGAIFDGTLSGGTVAPRLFNVTISGNIADVGGGIYNAINKGRGSLDLINVILWGDTATLDPASAEIKNTGATVTGTHLVVENGCPSDALITCSTVYKTSPLLGALREDGGYTRTMLPAYGSSAIDTGLDVGCPIIDQRGQFRPMGAHCEIGAVEVIPPPPPVADPKSISLPKNTSKEVAFSASDSNPGGPFSYTYAVVTGPSHGLLTVPTDVTTYVPTKDYVGPDSFTYTATDVNGTSAPATVLITVTPLPPPVALPFDVTTPRNTPKSIALAATDENAGGPFTYTFALVDLTTHGTVALAGGIATYTPDTNYVGPDQFTYTATDVNGTSVPATVTIHVLPVVPPVALPRAIVVPYNTSKSVKFGATDGNPGGPFAYTFSVATMPAHGTLGLVEGDTILYTPTHNYSGPDVFTYIVTDVNGVSIPATVTITVLPPGSSSSSGPAAIPTLSTLGMFTLAGALGLLCKRRLHKP